MRHTALGALLCLVATIGVAQADVFLTPVGSYETGIFDEGATEISAFDASTARLYSVNGFTGAIDVIDLTNPAMPMLLFSIDVSAYGAGANSVDVSNGLVAAAVEANVTQDPGSVVLFDLDGSFVAQYTVGALPDMLTFTPDGSTVLVACEGEPNDDYSVDPNGALGIVDVVGGTATVVEFTNFNGQEAALRADGVRIFGPGASASQDLEPEYIVYDPATGVAYVLCQENNAIVTVDVATATVVGIVPLGFKDHSLPGNGLDVSDRDGAINIANWPIYGMYQPDGSAGVTIGGNFYIVTANEGDARDYDTFSEESRVKNLVLDPTAFPNAATLQLDENLGRKNATTTLGDTDGDLDYDEIYVYGARSFSIWDAAGNLVWDSGDDFEQRIAVLFPDEFNSTNDENGSFDNRSDNKGVEPEAIAIAEIDGRVFAIIGLERFGGLFRYDITDPTAPFFVEYVTTRDFTGDPAAGTAGGLGPEGLLFIDAADSPVGQALVISSNEISGSIDVYLLDESAVKAEEDAPIVNDVVRTGLRGAFPNPFNPATAIKYSVERDQNVTIEVIDVRGRRVATLFDGMQSAGDHSLVWTPTELASGVYYARMVTEDRVHVQSMTLVK